MPWYLRSLHLIPLNIYYLDSPIYFFLLVFYFPCLLVQGKEYIFVANSDNLGAVVDLRIHI